MSLQSDIDRLRAKIENFTMKTGNAPSLATSLIRTTYIVLAALVSVTFSLRAQAPFAPGTLSVLRCGDGLEPLTNTGNSVFIDQYQRNGALVGSLAIPNSGPDALILSGVAGS